MNEATHTAGNKVMKRATKGMVAGALGIGLLTGGATFALWDDDATVAGATITAGNLDIAPSGAQVWQDISPDVEGSPVIDPTTFKMVPGDEIRMTQQIKIELEGKNLHARVAFDVPGLEGGLSEYVSGEYEVYFAGGHVAGGDLDGTSSKSFAINPAGTEDHTQNQGLYTVEIRLTFDPTAEDQSGVTLNTVLENMMITLEQERDLAAQ